MALNRKTFPRKEKKLKGIETHLQGSMILRYISISTNPSTLILNRMRTWGHLENGQRVHWDLRWTSRTCRRAMGAVMRAQRRTPFQSQLECNVLNGADKGMYAFTSLPLLPSSFGQVGRTPILNSKIWRSHPPFVSSMTSQDFLTQVRRSGLDRINQPQ